MITNGSCGSRVVEALHRRGRADGGAGDRARPLEQQRGPDTTGSAAAAELADRFDGRLEFGTAGLRGVLGAGPQRMNRVVVRARRRPRAYLRRRRGAPSGGVVIGHDARHNSRVFAEDTAACSPAPASRPCCFPARCRRR